MIALLTSWIPQALVGLIAAIGVVGVYLGVRQTGVAAQRAADTAAEGKQVKDTLDVTRQVDNMGDDDLRNVLVRPDPHTEK